MIYVFDVISGKFLAFEHATCITLVADLRLAIERTTGILVNNQILLVSGGQVPINENPVEAYDVGTEDNPYFLFARPAFIASGTDLGRSVTNVEDSIPQNTQTTGLLTTAEQLVHAQHLQHQGWQAAVGNLSDVISNVRNGASKLRLRIERLQKDEANLSSIESFSVDEDGAAVEETVQRVQLSSDLLSKLPLPNSLKSDNMINACDLVSHQIGMSSQAVIDELDNTQDTLKEAFLLLETFEKWATEGERTDMREIMRLTDRLGQLDQLLHSARQHCTGQGFSASPPPFTGASSPPSNFVSRSLSDVVGRCAAAAAELRNNLTQRVDWLSAVQSRLARCAAQFVITSATIRRRHKAIRNALCFISAPSYYVKLAIAQHSCRSSNFRSCMPCPVHSHATVSESFGNLDFLHPLYSLFSFCNASCHNVGHGQNHLKHLQGTPVVFAISDLEAIREAVPSLYADQNRKVCALNDSDSKKSLTPVPKSVDTIIESKKGHDAETSTDSLSELKDLCIKLQKHFSTDRDTLKDLRLSVDVNMASSFNLMDECKRVLEKIAIHQFENLSTNVQTQDMGSQCNEDGEETTVSPDAQPKDVSTSRPQARLNVAISGISKGDLVIVSWSEELQQPVVLTISPVPHLIHQDSIDLLSQGVPQNPILHWLCSPDLIIGSTPSIGGSPSVTDTRPAWFQPPNHYRLAEVIEKQHCQVRRASNRYRLQVNTRFFRLHVRPVSVEPALTSVSSAHSLSNVAEERRTSAESEQLFASSP